MSGSAIISPTVVDNTLIQDGQAAGSINPADMRQLNDSLAGMSTAQVSGTTYTYALADRGTMLESTSASGTTFNVPSSGSVNFQQYSILLWRQYGTGTLTLSGATNVVIRSPSGIFTAPSQYSQGGLHYRGSNEWILWGT